MALFEKIFIRKEKGGVIVEPFKEEESENVNNAMIVLEEALKMVKLSIKAIDVWTETGVVMFIFDKPRIYGGITKEKLELDSLHESLIQEIKSLEREKETVEKEKKIPKEKFEKVKELLHDYVGGFADVLYENQIKLAGINLEDATESDFLKFLNKLQAAISMIIGFTRSREVIKEIKEQVLKE